MRRNQLHNLIAALNASITARQNVLNDNNFLGNLDVNGGHADQIVREQNLRTAAQNDLATLNHHPAGAWMATPNRPNQERRVSARCDRDPIRYETRNVVNAADAAKGWKAVQPRGRRRRG